MTQIRVFPDDAALGAAAGKIGIGMTIPDRPVRRATWIFTARERLLTPVRSIADSNQVLLSANHGHNSTTGSTISRITIIEKLPIPATAAEIIMTALDNHAIPAGANDTLGCIKSDQPEFTAGLLE